MRILPRVNTSTISSRIEGGARILQDRALNPFFVCDLTELILERRPRPWLHGHSHASTRAQIGETTVLCNPFG
jgi:hypothetical protein